MKKHLALFAVILILLAAGCAVVTVKYDYHTQTDFSRYRAFNFLPPADTERKNDLMIDRVQSEVLAGLEAKGFELNADKPDFLIAVFVNRKERVDLLACGYSYYPMGFYWRPPHYWGGPWGIDCPRYDEGKVILDFVDAESKKLVWRAVAEEDLPYPENPDTMKKYVRRAVSKMLKHFPPK